MKQNKMSTDMKLGMFEKQPNHSITTNNYALIAYSLHLGPIYG